MLSEYCCYSHMRNSPLGVPCFTVWKLVPQTPLATQRGDAIHPALDSLKKPLLPDETHPVSTVLSLLGSKPTPCGLTKKTSACQKNFMDTLKTLSGIREHNHWRRTSAI